ncbi:OmpA family protein [Acidisphaera sp. L21]|jgi:outer membrane protein OmpA-like peptidoglycan-associated protein|uniref:OmpA family protein n=1 Tax=Acidisphaera sp. L21 TaxID=1641851 RepID=UPI00131AE129|nr:OmpA family protein [Acidisphaera sp. L21]
MRRLAIGLGLLALSACAMQPPDRIYPVFFNDFSANLDPAGMGVVSNAASVAQKYPSYKVKVTGYSDRAGSPEADVSLSKARADAVAGLLMQDGVDAGRIVRSAVGTPPNSQPGVERRRVEIDIDN